MTVFGASLLLDVVVVVALAHVTSNSPGIGFGIEPLRVDVRGSLRQLRFGFGGP